VVPLRNTLRPVLAALLVVSLSGCGPSVRINASVKDGAIEFAICDAIQVEAISVGYFEPQKADDETLWALTGNESWSDGHILKYGIAPTGWTVSEGPGPLNLFGDQIYLSLNTPPQTLNTNLDSRKATFDPNLLVEGKWLNQTGQVSSKPCN
jgi:hypothetical protein